MVSSEGSKVHVRFESGELRIFKGAPLERVAAGYSTGGRGRTGSLGSIRSSDDRMIVDCINLEKFDAEELVDESNWRLICAARGRNFGAVDPEAWQSLCAKRGYLLYRRNPRGF